MCLILFAYDLHPDFRLVLAANRDEYYARPTLPAGYWVDAPDVLAGRDLVGGGTWLGVTRSGRFAAVANVRDPADRRQGLPSRGGLTADFLCGREPLSAYLEMVARRGAGYRGFNLLLGEGGALAYYCNRDGGVRMLAPGLYGLSNARLDTPWPKVVTGKAAMESIIAAPGPLAPAALFALLADTSRPADDQLPDTGIGIERERILSSRFIASPDYGTRAATVLLLRRDGALTLIERIFARAPQRWTEVRYDLGPPAAIPPQ